jgi:Protein of unknown function (DUF2924)
METLPIQSSLAALERMCYAQLVKSWQETFHHPPPAKCGEALLRGALAWQTQAKQFGGLSSSELKILRHSASSSTQSLNLSVGSRLVRVWQGDTHQVTVLDKGFEYAGQRWLSLSAIARAITGTRWSGPVFFGLKRGDL